MTYEDFIKAHLRLFCEAFPSIKDHIEEIRKIVSNPLKDPSDVEYCKGVIDIVYSSIDRDDPNFILFDEAMREIFPMICPETGSFIGYKKAITKDSIITEFEFYDPDRNCYRAVKRIPVNYDPTIVIVKLEIPEEARRGSGAFSRKCRCDKAKVIGMELMNGEPYDGVAVSFYDSDFEYKLGEKVIEPGFNSCRWFTCAPGIHFFMTKEEAMNYIF